MEKALLENPTMNLIVLNDPCNPTGVKYPVELLEEIAKLLMKPEFSHVMIASDETYHELVYGDNQVIFTALLKTDF